MANDNRDRLNRVIRGLQLLQRTNPPASSISRAAGKALAPLLKEMANWPEVSAQKAPGVDAASGQPTSYVQSVIPQS